jgi:PAS domain S-box-containing protein
MDTLGPVVFLTKGAAAMSSEPLFTPTLTQTTEQLARLYRLVVRELEDFAVFTAAPDGRITTWNYGVERMFGYSELEWLGQHASIIFNEEDRAAGVVETELAAVAQLGRCVNVRWHVRKDGSLVYMNGVLRGLHDEQGNLIGYSKICADDTVRKRLEDALTESNRDLQQFAFIASHDLQEPLRTLNVLGELLRGSFKERIEPEAERILGFMNQTTIRLSTLIHDLLEYSQLMTEETGATSVHLDEDVETAASLLRSSIEQTSAIVTHDALPSVEVDRCQTVRLFQNLIGNALKFRKQDQPPRIHVSAERQGNEWMIRVTDNGIGFPRNEAENIFDPFKRLHSAQDVPGSGIGLAVCKRIVERSHGRIGAESRPGEGSTFWFTLPASRN